MSKRRKKIDNSNQRQLSLFDEIQRIQQDLAACREKPTQGSLNITEKLRAAMVNERCLNCDQYSRCLALAAEKDWESFTCQGCGYALRGRANFGIADFVTIEEDAGEEAVYIFCQSQVDGLIICNEDLYETFFGKGLLDE